MAQVSNSCRDAPSSAPSGSAKAAAGRSGQHTGCPDPSGRLPHLGVDVARMRPPPRSRKFAIDPVRQGPMHVTTPVHIQNSRQPDPAAGAADVVDVATQ